MASALLNPLERMTGTSGWLVFRCRRVSSPFARRALIARCRFLLSFRVTFQGSGFPADDQVILTALKKYGMILADNGSAIFISGAPDSRWNNSNLNLLKTITAS